MNKVADQRKKNPPRSTRGHSRQRSSKLDYNEDSDDEFT